MKDKAKQITTRRVYDAMLQPVPLYRETKDALIEAARAEGEAVSETVRRAIDLYLSKRYHKAGEKLPAKGKR